MSPNIAIVTERNIVITIAILMPILIQEGDDAAADDGAADAAADDDHDDHDDCDDDNKPQTIATSIDIYIYY